MEERNKLLEFCKEKQTLIIYGAGRFGEVVKNYLHKRGIKITCFCVTSIDEREVYLGYPVKEITEIRSNYAYAGIIIAVNEKYSVNVLKEVKGLDYFYDKSLLEAIDYEETMERAKGWIEKVEVRDGILYRVGTTFFSKDTTYIVCPGPIGDTLYVAALVKAYKQKYKVSSVVLIVRKNHESIGEMFPSVDGCIVSHELVETLSIYSRSKKVWDMDNYRYGFGREDYQHHIYAPAYVSKNFLSGYKIAIMGLEEEAEYEEIKIDRDANLLNAFNQKTVIVMPHESSARRLPFKFWEALCLELSKNFTVYTNTKDETELPIKGTQPISYSLKDMAGICERCFAVISIRTGICDMLAFTKTNLIVLNTELILADKWNLKKVFSRDNIVNIDCYNDWNVESLKDSILEKLKSFCRGEQ